jgi:hypothetical protein
VGTITYEACAALVRISRQREQPDREHVNTGIAGM